MVKREGQSGMQRSYLFLIGKHKKDSAAYSHRVAEEQGKKKEELCDAWERRKINDVAH